MRMIDVSSDATEAVLSRISDQGEHFTSDGILYILVLITSV